MNFPIKPVPQAHRRIPKKWRAGLAVTAAIRLLLAAQIPAFSQELEIEATPFSTLIDFGLLQNEAAAAPSSLPIWLESVQMLREEPATLTDLPSPPALKPLADPGAPFSVANMRAAPPSHTTYRLRLRALPGLNDHLLLRLYFDDTPDSLPVVTGWSETGTQYYASPPLGSGLDLPNTATLHIPTAHIDYLDITVPGDGSTIRQAFLSTLQTTASFTPLDFSKTEKENVQDPFNNAADQTPSPENYTPSSDRLLFGRIHASLDDGEIRITPQGQRRSTSYDIEFTLAGSPLLSTVCFEILNADPTLPMQAAINGTAIGPISTQFPDLSDPAYSGQARPFESMSFRYTSWASCQKIIPGRLLQPGENRFTLELPPGSPPIAIRRIRIQLKHHWKKLDYTLAPD